MSRVRGFIPNKAFSENRRIDETKVSLKLLRPLVITSVTIGLLSICILCFVNYNVFAFQVTPLHEKFTIEDSNLKMEKNLLTFVDHDMSGTSALEKELSRLKIKTVAMDMMLRKMKMQLATCHMPKKDTGGTLPDFASEAAGGAVIATPDTESYYESHQNKLTVFGIPIWTLNYFSPRKIIQPWTQPGECWAFRGTYGKIEIQLAYPIKISHVTMEHIPVSASLTGEISSAPKEFSVIGNFGDRHITIDTFTYDINGTSIQTFAIKGKQMKEISFKRIMLEILSNWGNPEHTCIYRFRVHGQIFHANN